MPQPTATRKYGKKSTRTKGERLFSELPQSPVRKPRAPHVKDPIKSLTESFSGIAIVDEEKQPRRSPQRKAKAKPVTGDETTQPAARAKKGPDELTTADGRASPQKAREAECPQAEDSDFLRDDTLRTLTWDDVCPPGDRIAKIAEASYAEVYRVTNERGTSIIKVIRLESPIKPQTKTQVRSGLVDEKPRSDAEIRGELRISEWLADIPGFVMYKERYTVQGKTTKGLLETHQAFHRKMKRQDPGRAQFYPSPSRYLDDTKFLVVELGDAGKALEDWELSSESQLWDIFLLEAIALARAEDVAMFEVCTWLSGGRISDADELLQHRDLHEGNLCIKQAASPRERDPTSGVRFGYSGLDITILDFGLSRAEDLSIDFAKPVAYDLERDLSLFTSNHAPQCEVYGQMRSFLLRADRKCLPPEEHVTPYAQGVEGPLSWEVYAPYTNVLWLAYLYRYLVGNFAGDKKELLSFRKATKGLWRHLNPDAGDHVPCFESAEDIVCFAVENGWIREGQLTEGASVLDREESIILSRDEWEEASVHGSPRRRQTRDYTYYT